ncbi:MAG: hypothetical protein JSV27_11305 [Candidatus Bathyarchaeota archaeon]|nr:MAG: hypothetical protein JSV27_11305 [Candidatus Bathyarchaeota archaeon]
MAHRLFSDVPQIISIVRASLDGAVNLKKEVREHLEIGDGSVVHMNIGDEVTLSKEGGEGVEVPIRGRGIVLPIEAIARLGLEKGGLVGFVQRPGAIAVKRVELEEEGADFSSLFDLETPTVITRRVETNPLPEELLPALIERNRDLKLNHELEGFLKGRQTLEALKTREILGVPENSDTELREALTAQRLDKQESDGSWGGGVTATARMLREMAELDLNRDDPGVKSAAAWLLSRPESPHNPGMFFLRDELVGEQVELVERRTKQKTGSRPRFRKLLASENKLVAQGDPMIKKACGPRIMWPNSIVVEALLKAGYEDDERVQANLGMLSHGHWCECGYQHGRSGWRESRGTLTDEEITNLERKFINQYRFGHPGLSSLEELAEKDLAHKVGPKLPRVSETEEDGVRRYPLYREGQVQGCELLTARALHLTKDERLRRLVEAYLWRLAAVQREDGRFHYIGRSGRYVNNVFHEQQPGMLEFFARFDHPVSHVVIHRSLPWIVENQNEDGSWGQEPHRDVATLAVVRALDRIGFFGEP